jgi:hypothetical protein
MTRHERMIECPRRRICINEWKGTHEPCRQIDSEVTGLGRNLTRRGRAGEEAADGVLQVAGESLDPGLPRTNETRPQPRLTKLLHKLVEISHDDIHRRPLRRVILDHNLHQSLEHIQIAVVLETNEGDHDKVEECTVP